MSSWIPPFAPGRVAGPTYPIVPSEQALQRVLSLAVMVYRGMMESRVFMARRRLPEDQAKFQKIVDSGIQRAESLNRGLHTQGHWDVMSAKERTLLSKAPGSWRDIEILNGMRRADALGVIAWALGLVPAIPSYDTMFDVDSLINQLLSKGDAEVAKNVSARAEDEIRHARDVAELWMWRAWLGPLLEKKLEEAISDGRTYREVFEATCEEASRLGVVKLIDGDFAAFGKAYRNLDDKEYATMLELAPERLLGLNWFCGDASDWDGVKLR